MTNLFDRDCLCDGDDTTSSRDPEEDDDDDEDEGKERDDCDDIDTKEEEYEKGIKLTDPLLDMAVGGVGEVGVGAVIGVVGVVADPLVCPRTVVRVMPKKAALRRCSSRSNCSFSRSSSNLAWR